MLHSHNGQAKTPDLPAQAAPLHLSDEVAQFMQDFLLEDPDFVHALRRDLRVWFLNHIQGWEERFGSKFEVQMLGYEVLDELLSKIISPTSLKVNP